MKRAMKEKSTKVGCKKIRSSSKRISISPRLAAAYFMRTAVMMWLLSWYLAGKQSHFR